MVLFVRTSWSRCVKTLSIDILATTMKIILQSTSRRLLNSSRESSILLQQILKMAKYPCCLRIAVMGISVGVREENCNQWDCSDILTKKNTQRLNLGVLRSVCETDIGSKLTYIVTHRIIKCNNSVSYV